MNSALRYIVLRGLGGYQLDMNLVAFLALMYLIIVVAYHGTKQEINQVNH